MSIGHGYVLVKHLISFTVSLILVYYTMYSLVSYVILVKHNINQLIGLKLWQNGHDILS